MEKVLKRRVELFLGIIVTDRAGKMLVYRDRKGISLPILSCPQCSCRAMVEKEAKEFSQDWLECHLELPSGSSFLGWTVLQYHVRNYMGDHTAAHGLVSGWSVPQGWIVEEYSEELDWLLPNQYEQLPADQILLVNAWGNSRAEERKIGLYVNIFEQTGSFPVPSIRAAKPTDFESLFAAIIKRSGAVR